MPEHAVHEVSRLLDRNRHELVGRLLLGSEDEVAARGIQTSVHFSPVHRFELYANNGADLPLSDTFAERTVSLPMFAEMEESQQAQVIEAIRGALG